MKTITLNELVENLQIFVDGGHGDKPVRCWLPGSSITLSTPFVSAQFDAVMIEGNVDEGSALEGAVTDTWSRHLQEGQERIARLDAERAAVKGLVS